MAVDFTTSTLAALANAVSGLSGAVTPIIDDAVSQKYDTEFKENITEINKALEASTLDPTTIDALCLRLLSDCGQTVGGMGEVVGISVGNLAALFNVCASEIKNMALLANVTFKQNTPSS